MKHPLLLFLFGLLTCTLQANGDPVTSASALIASANPAPRKIVDIQLEREDLLIKPGYYTTVSVKYVLHNTSDKDYINIDYAFPVDYMGGGEEYYNSGWSYDCCSESSYTLGWQDKYIKDISFTIDGKELDSKVSDETKISGPDEKPNRAQFTDSDAEFEYEDAEFWYTHDSVYRRWFYTQFSILRGEKVILEVKYAIQNSRKRGAMQSRFGVGAGSGCRLQYDMSPAQNWGNGKTKDLYVKVDASELSSEDDFFEKSKELHTLDNVIIEGLPLEQTTKGIYTYQAKNFDFKTCNLLALNYNLINDIPISELLGARISPDEYTITTTDEVTQYPITNLSDLDFSTAWVSTLQNGVNQKINIKFKNPTSVYYMLIINGYHKNESTYLNNNRLKNIRVAYKRNDESRMKNIGEYIREISEYKPINLNVLQNHEDVIATNPYVFESDINEIEIEIKDIHSGNMFHDTCISEIILLRRF